MSEFLQYKRQRLYKRLLLYIGFPVMLYVGMVLKGFIDSQPLSDLRIDITHAEYRKDSIEQIVKFYIKLCPELDSVAKNRKKEYFGLHAGDCLPAKVRK